MLDSSSDWFSLARVGRWEPETCSLMCLMEVQDGRGAFFVQGSIDEISLGGCYVNTPETLPVGTSLKMIISFGEQTFITNAVVLYVHEQLGMRIAFEESGAKLN